MKKHRLILFFVQQRLTLFFVLIAILAITFLLGMLQIITGEKASDALIIEILIVGIPLGLAYQESDGEDA